MGIGDRAILYSLGLINIGSDVTISQHAHICAGTHNHTDVSFPLIKTPIKIEESAWVAADAFIGPGTTIRAGAIVAARAVVVRDVDEYTVVAGNPASIISRRD